MLEGEQSHVRNQYVMSCDLGLVRDATVVAVGHAEDTSPEPGAPKRVVIDSLKRWRGKRLHPVQLSDGESYLALTATRHNRAKVYADPWQAAGIFSDRRPRASTASNGPLQPPARGRLGQSLHLALKNGLLWLPKDDDLLSERCAAVEGNRNRSSQARPRQRRTRRPGDLLLASSVPN